MKLYGVKHEKLMIRDIIIKETFDIVSLINKNFTTWQERYSARLIVIQILVGKETPMLDIQDAFNQLLEEKEGSE